MRNVAAPRVLVVPEAYPPSPTGIAVSADRIVTHLRRSGVDVWVVDFDCRGEFTSPPSVTIDPSRDHTILVTPFFDNQGPVRIPERVKATTRREAALQLANVARPLDIGLVHSLSVFNAGFVATFVASALGTPHVVGVRGFGRHPFDGLRAECVRWVLERAAAVVISNRSLLELLSVAHPAEAAGAIVIPDAIFALPYPGLDPTARAAIRAQAGAGPETVLITLAANLREKKLLALVLRALASVPDPTTARLLVLGRVQPGIQEQFESDKRRLGLDTSVLMRESPPPGAIPDWLEASDIVVMPSVDYGTTNIVLEAMERARCVVASDAFAEVIRHEQDGILVNGLDPEALGSALASLATDPDNRHRLGSAARARVLAERRPDREARAYVELYERMVAA